MGQWDERAPELQTYLDKGYDYRSIATIYGVSYKNLRNRISELRQSGLLTTPPPKPKKAKSKSLPKLKPKEPEVTGYKETVEIHSDGTHKSDKLLRMSEEQSKDENYLLKAHGYDKDMWELVSAKNKIWNVYSKQDGVQTLYSSNITVKPRVSGWTFNDLIAAIVKDTQPIEVDIEQVVVDDKRMLEISFYDMHFGISDYDYYRPTLMETYRIIGSKRWEQVLFVIGQDLLHNDNFRGTTSSGTPIESVDIPNAWRDAKRFYSSLIWRALRNSNHVKVMYSKGNHDEAMSWAFTQWIGAKFPQVELEASVEERKVHVFGKVFLGVTHGDKARKDLIQLFPAEFPMEWAQTTYREIHDGHLHREDAIDGYGIMSRTLATRNKTDKWHRDKGFTTAHKRFMLFEYNTEELKHIHYV